MNGVWSAACRWRQLCVISLSENLNFTSCSRNFVSNLCLLCSTSFSSFTATSLTSTSSSVRQTRRLSSRFFFFIFHLPPQGILAHVRWSSWCSKNKTYLAEGIEFSLTINFYSCTHRWFVSFVLLNSVKNLRCEFCFLKFYLKSTRHRKVSQHHRVCIC